MKNQKKTIQSAIWAMICPIMLIAPLSAASEIGGGGACTPDLVPVALTGTSESSGYIQPTCSKCRRLKVERQTSQDGELQGVLGLMYFDDALPEFGGSIELTMLLDDDTEQTVTIENVDLIEGQEAEWVIEAPPEWHWDHVDMVWLTFVPAQAV